VHEEGVERFGYFFFVREVKGSFEWDPDES
jgi:hypothetical protein